MKVSELGFGEYVETMACLVTKKLGEDVKVKPVSIVKNNGTIRKGLSVEENTNNMNPNIYLEEMYGKQKADDITMEQAAEEFIWYYESVKHENFPTDFFSWERVKEFITIRVINAEWNKELLKKVPHKKILDLVIVYHAVIEVANGNTMFMMINNEQLKNWGITQEILDKTAKANMNSLTPAELFPMEEVIKEVLGGNETAVSILDGKPEYMEKNRMYILTNKDRNFGASVLFYDGMAERIGKLMETDFFVIPSSVHEIIIVKDSGDYTQEEITEMIKAVNEQAVDREDRLAEHAYHYSVRTGCLSA